MKKNWMFLIIALLLVAGVGGKVYMDNKEERKEAEKIEAERASVEALKNTFADIKSVEFEKSSYNVMTGYYNMNVKMTNIKGEYVQFSFMFALSHPDEIDGWGVKDKKNVQKEGQTIGQVKVIFTNGNEEEI